MFNLWFFKKLDSSRDKYTNKNTQLCSHTHTQISWPFWLKMSWRVLKWGHAVYEEQNWLRCERRTGSSHYGGLQPNNKPRADKQTCSMVCGESTARGEAVRLGGNVWRPLGGDSERTCPAETAPRHTQHTDAASSGGWVQFPPRKPGLPREKADFLTEMGKTWHKAVLY